MIDVRPRKKLAPRLVRADPRLADSMAVAGNRAAILRLVSLELAELDPLARVRAAEVDVTATALDVINLGLLVNGVPLVEGVRIRNEGTEPLEEILVRIWVAPDHGEAWEQSLPELAPGEAWDVGAVTPPLDLARLARPREAELAHLRLEVRAEDRPLFSASQPLRVHAANEWIFLRDREWTLASYVFPNHPPVERVISRARGPLERAGWGTAFDGYQSGNPAKIRAMVAAIHETLVHDLDLAYVNPPASFETTGQKVFLPADIERHRRGTCLDLALFFAGIVERAGLAPLVFLIPGHAFAGVWLCESEGHTPVERSVERAREALAAGKLLAIEATACTQALEADAAFALAEEHLRQHPLVAAIDVGAARLRGALPIPIAEHAA